MIFCERLTYANPSSILKLVELPKLKKTWYKDFSCQNHNSYLKKWKKKTYNFQIKKFSIYLLLHTIYWSVKMKKWIYFIPNLISKILYKIKLNDWFCHTWSSAGEWQKVTKKSNTITRFSIPNQKRNEYEWFSCQHFYWLNKEKKNTQICQ